MEFFNIHQLWYILRMIVACACGVMIGLERRNRSKEAGVRTHCVVACASALMMIISKYGFADTVIGENGVRGADGARIAAQVVSGIGFLGAGKSTLARNVGTMFKRRFIDTDRLVVRRCGKSVTEIFETEGEDRFRELETSALRSLQSERSLLVSCGGGIVETPVNIELMHEMGTCVYLEGDFEDSIRQIRRSDTRPDFRSPEHAARLFEHRRPLYRQAANLTLDIRNKSFEDVSYLCAEMLLERGLL